jgi:3-dehydrosphinganine reductase
MRGLNEGRFFITTDFETAILLNNMRDPSPRDTAFVDMLLSLLAFFIWPFVRRSFDKATIKYTKRNAI